MMEARLQDICISLNLRGLFEGELYLYIYRRNDLNIGYLLLLLTHCGRVTQICVFNTVKLGTSASSP